MYIAQAWKLYCTLNLVSTLVKKEYPFWAEEQRKEVGKGCCQYKKYRPVDITLHYYTQEDETHSEESVKVGCMQLYIVSSSLYILLAMVTNPFPAWIYWSQEDDLLNFSKYLPKLCIQSLILILHSRAESEILKSYRIAPKLNWKMFANGGFGYALACIAVVLGVKVLSCI